ncbi:MAG: fused MFS/spermidine synthase [Acidobacteriota bacterium]|nr:fused MFS/spermidine synthase [Acidobacteriota bacterium]
MASDAGLGRTALLRLTGVVTLSGAIFMAFEILSSRILSPHFGNSVYVWGSIISIFLAALSIGYAWGGHLADRQPRIEVLGRLLTFAGVFQVLLLLWGVRLAGVFADWTGGHPAGTLLAATVLFGPVSVLFGTVSPYAVRLASRELHRVGNTAGRLYALSTVGSLAGTLVCTFVFIPWLDLHRILALLLALTATTAILALAARYRTEPLALTLAVVLGVLAVVEGAIPKATVQGGLYKRITPYQSLLVTEVEGIRRLKSDRWTQGAIRVENGEPAIQYPRYASAALLLNPEIENVLIMGLGTGGVGTHLSNQLPDLEVHYVEIDPAVLGVAKRFFFFEESPKTRVHLVDARRFLARSERTWDFIYCDVYVGNAVPFHLTTVEFIREVKTKLSSRGVFGFNVASGVESPFTRALYRTIAEEFTLVMPFEVKGAGNELILATSQESWIPAEKLIEIGRSLDERWSFDPTIEQVARQWRPLDLDLLEIPILTDEHAPVEHLVLLSSSVPPKRGGT